MLLILLREWLTHWAGLERDSIEVSNIDAPYQTIAWVCGVLDIASGAEDNQQHTDAVNESLEQSSQPGKTH